ncbi:hypothetical protein OGZ02_13525 [Brachyspira hyodysenteriae]|nr:hypothetical protein [Brachyspira hyodysenteriae]MDA1469822.1 hypothetical protein [Brachyspira hyodysenteriae]
MLEASDDGKGVIATDIGSEFNSDILIVKGGGSVSPITEENVLDKTNTIYMEGTEVFKKAVKNF